jgi:integrase
MASLQPRGKNYFVRYRDEHGKQRTVKAGPDKSNALRIKRDIENRVCAIKAGSLDPREAKWADSERRPVLEHAADWRNYLAAKGTVARHSRQSHDRVARLIGFAKITRVSGLTIGPVQVALADLRKHRGRRGRQRFADNSIVAYARAIKSFSRWLWKDGRIRDDALAHMSLPEVADKMVRRALESEEAALLLSIAPSQPTAAGMTGEDRSIMYAIALGTGYRISEILSLTPESFDLAGDPPTITCRAEHTKNRKLAVQPILPELAELLRPWLARRPAGVPVLKIRPDRAAGILRQDLAAAGVEEAEAYDFHALRHTYVTLIIKGGATARVAQELARHSDPRLTMNIYTHLTVTDTAKGLAGLAHTLITTPVSIGLTGTDSAHAISSLSGPQMDSPHSQVRSL